MSTENASALAEGQNLPADTSQQTNVTETENQEQAPEKTFTQAELDAIVQKRAAKAERKAEARYQELQREIQELKTPKAAEAKTESAPKREEFNSYEDFVEARALHAARQETKKEIEAFKSDAEKKTKETTQASARKEFEGKRDSMVAAGQKAYADFDAVVNEAVEDGLLPNRGPFFEAMVESEIGEKIAYHLAKNPKEAERIAALSVYRQLSELGKLEDKLSATKAPRETMEPIAGRTQVNTGLRDDMSMDAYVKARQKQANQR